MKSKAKVFILIVVTVLASLSGVSLLVRLAYSLALVLVLGYIWVRLNSRSLEAKVVRSTQTLQVGQWLEEEITVRNAGILPKHLVEVRSNADLPGYGSATVVSLLPRRSGQWRTRTRCQRRGRYSLAPLTVISGDLFGLFLQERSLGEPQDLIVYPATLDLSDFLSNSTDIHDEGRVRAGSHQVPPSVSGIRDYVPGDSLRHIHWPSTARTQRLMVKDFNPGSFREVWVFLDLNRAVQAGTGTESSEEYGVTIAASIAKRCLEADRPTGFVAWGDNHYLFPPQKGMHNFSRLLEALALVKASGGSPLGEVVSAHAERLGLNSTAVLITPSPGDLDAAVHHLTRRGVKTIAILFDAGSFHGSPLSLQAHTATERGRTYLVRKGDDIARVLNHGTNGRVASGSGERAWQG